MTIKSVPSGFALKRFTMLISYNDVLHSLCETYKQTYPHSRDHEILKEFIDINFQKREDEKSVTTFEQFCRSNNFLRKRVINVPLPSDLESQLIEININHRNVPDDIVYHEHEDIRKQIPRGLTFFKSSSSSSSSTDVCIFANRKFVGDMKYADRYFIRNYDDDPTRKIICMEKINGEALHFSCRYMNGKFYLFVGSKNNHILINQFEDINLYREERFQMAKTFARHLWKLLYQDISTINRNTLLSLLHHTKMTAICEILQKDNEHVVPINRDQILFIAFTSFYCSYNDYSLTAIPPHIGVNLMHMLTFTCAPYIILNGNLTDNEQYISESKKHINTEGNVLYFLDDQNRAIRMFTVKTEWYICLRALRQKARNINFSLNKNQEPDFDKIDQRYEDIQKWLNLSDKDKMHWIKLCKGFIHWLICKKFKIDDNYDENEDPDEWIHKIKTNSNRWPSIVSAYKQRLDPQLVQNFIHKFVTNWTEFYQPNPSLPF